MVGGTVGVTVAVVVEVPVTVAVALTVGVDVIVGVALGVSGVKVAVGGRVADGVCGRSVMPTVGRGLTV